jgi:hypothetical protein
MSDAVPNNDNDNVLHNTPEDDNDKDVDIDNNNNNKYQ